MDSLTIILARLNDYPALLEHLTLSNIHSFVVAAARLKNDIILSQPATVSIACPPGFLPTTIQQTLSGITGIPMWLISQCWMVVRDLVWSDAYTTRLQANLYDVFAEHGIRHGLGMFLNPRQCAVFLTTLFSSLHSSLSSELFLLDA